MPHGDVSPDRPQRGRRIKVLGVPGPKGGGEGSFTALLYSNMPEGVQVDDFVLRLKRLAQYDIMHVHWPEADLNTAPTWLHAYYRLRLRFAVMDRLRARGTKLIWTIHNLAAHEAKHPRLERWFWRQLHRRLDGAIALSEGGRKKALGRFPALKKVPGFVVRRGHYRGVYPNPPGVDARSELGLPKEAKVLLLFGEIRPYKDVPHLIDVFRRCSDPEMVLLIAGAPKGRQLGREVAARAAGDARIRIEAAHIPNEQLHLYFRSADLVVLPYREFLNSGVAWLALSFHRPILAANRGEIGELSELVGAEWVRAFEELTEGELAAAAEWARSQARPAMTALDHLDWQAAAQRTVDVYEQLLAPRA